MGGGGNEITYMAALSMEDDPPKLSKLVLFCHGLHYLPPCHPDLDPIDRVCDRMEQVEGNHTKNHLRMEDREQS